MNVPGPAHSANVMQTAEIPPRAGLTGSRGGILIYIMDSQRLLHCLSFTDPLSGSKPNPGLTSVYPWLN